MFDHWSKINFFKSWGSTLTKINLDSQSANFPFKLFFCFLHFLCVRKTSGPNMFSKNVEEIFFNSIEMFNTVHYLETLRNQLSFFFFKSLIFWFLHVFCGKKVGKFEVFPTSLKSKEETLKISCSISLDFLLHYPHRPGPYRQT